MGTLLSTLVDSEDQQTEDCHYTPNPDDVETVRRYLRCWVPVELANAIIDEAQYWPKAKYTVTSPDHSATLVTEFHGPECFLLTPKLSEMIASSKFVRIKKVGFKIISHDQGFCSENNFDSKYLGSYTWFEAAIVREVDNTSLGEEAETTDGLRSRIRYFMDEHGDVTGDGMEVSIVANPAKPGSNVWHLQRNIRASREDAIHEVIWSDEVPDDPEEDEMKFIDMTGAGRGIGFLKSLDINDRIGVLARAKFAAWANYVKEVEVEVYYSD